jgi:hypothetical protein
LILIKKYELKDLYKVYFVDRQDVEKYRIIWNKKDTEKKQIQYEKGRKELEYKKEQVLDDLLNHFLEKSISYVKNELEKEYLEYSESLEYYDETNDEYIEQYLFSILILIIRLCLIIEMYAYCVICSSKKDLYLPCLTRSPTRFIASLYSSLKTHTS